MLDAGVAFGANTVIFSSLARILPHANRMLLFVATGIIVGFALICWEMWTQSFPSIGFFAPVLLYACLCEFYLLSMAFCLASISASLLVRLRRGAMGEEAIGKAYSSESMISIRLDRMYNTGYLVEDGDSIQLSAKGKKTASVYQSFQNFFRHDELLP